MVPHFKNAKTFLSCIYTVRFLIAEKARVFIGPLLLTAEQTPGTGDIPCIAAQYRPGQTSVF